MDNDINMCIYRLKDISQVAHCLEVPLEQSDEELRCWLNAQSAYLRQEPASNAEFAYFIVEHERFLKPLLHGPLRA